MRRIALAVTLLSIMAGPAASQARDTREGEAIVGIIGHDDMQTIGGVRISPVGVTFGFIVQPLFRRRNVSLLEQVSFFPLSDYDRQADASGTPYPSRTNPFILNTTWLRVATGEPEAAGQNVFFAGAGLGFAIATPRDGTKATPMLTVGMRRWLRRQLGFEVAVQCGVQRIGESACFLPVTSVWPFS